MYVHVVEGVYWSVLAYSVDDSYKRRWTCMIYYDISKMSCGILRRRS